MWQYMLLGGVGAEPVAHLMPYHLLMMVKSRSHHDIAHLYKMLELSRSEVDPYQIMSLPNSNFLHLTVSEIYPRQDFIGQGQYGKAKL